MQKIMLAKDEHGDNEKDGVTVCQPFMGVCSYVYPSQSWGDAGGKKKVETMEVRNGMKKERRKEGIG